MEYTLLNPIILMFATWRVTSLIVKELGPFNVLERMRFGRSLCFDCVSVWTAFIISLIFYNATLTLLLTMTLAISAGVMLLENFIDALLKMP